MFSVDLDDQEAEYSLNATAMRHEFLESELWSKIRGALRDLHVAYASSHGDFNLLPSGKVKKKIPDPKTWARFREKTFRMNVIDNASWEHAEVNRWPTGGWVEPRTWFGQVTDVVRCSVVVRYLDGTDLVAQEVDRVATSLGFDTSVKHRAQERGYFAIHIGILYPMRLRVLGALEEVAVPIEIQVRTQAQDAIQELTHHFYTDRQGRHADSGKPWQWKYNEDEFVPNFVGHTLHFIDGMLLAAKTGREDGRR